MKSRDEGKQSTMGRRAQTHTAFERTTIKAPDGMPFFKIDKEGVYRLRILGYKVGKGNPFADKGQFHPERTYYRHFDIGVNEDSYVCPAKTYGEACPICEHRAKLARKPGTDPDTLKALDVKERQLWIVMDLSDPEKGYQLWDTSYHTFGKLLDKRIKEADPDEDFDKFYFLAGGADLKIGTTEKPLPRGKYYDVASIDFKTRKDDIEDDVVAGFPCLDDLIVKTPYEKLKAIFLQIPESAQEADDDDGDGEPAKPAKPKKPATPADDEDDDGDAEAAPAKPAKPAKKPAKPADDQDDDGDSEPAKPAKPAKKPAQTADDDDDWDDDDGDSEPEKPAKQEKPAKPKKPAKPADDDDDWDDDDDAEPAKPAAKPAKKPAKPSKPADDDDDWDDDDDAEPAKPAAKPAKKPAKPSKPADDDDDWDDDDE